MGEWYSSPHPISDLRDWHNLNRLEIQPDFQRREVWSRPAKVMLIDTILRGIPMPKVLLGTILSSGQTHRIVVDGQQRISTIISFLEDEFPLERPYEGIFQGYCFSQLPEEWQEHILNYQIDFNEIRNYDDEELREVYNRFNKYTFALNKQELRKADFPGDFLRLSEELSTHSFFEEAKVFTPANRRRLGDIEYVSEILAGLISGPQDKKTSLDNFYLNYSSWEESHYSYIGKRFEEIIEDIQILFSGWKDIKDTRFKQKADLYALFLAIYQLKEEGGSIFEKNLNPVKDDLWLLDNQVSPSAFVVDLKRYALKVVSQANSLSSRQWRIDFLKNILSGTYKSEVPTGDAAQLYLGIVDGLAVEPVMVGCPSEFVICPFCEKEFHYTEESGELRLGWPAGVDVYQISNAEWMHADCIPSITSWSYISGFSPSNFENIDEDDGSNESDSEDSSEV